MTNRVALGAHNEPLSPNNLLSRDAAEFAADVDAFETLTGRELAYSIVQPMEHDTPVFRFPREQAEALAERGITPLLLLSTYWPGALPLELRLDNMVEHGSADGIFTRFAQDIAAFGRPVICSFGWEFTLPYTPWSGWYYGEGAPDTLDGVAWPRGPKYFCNAYRRFVWLVRPMAPKVSFLWQDRKSVV